MSELSFLNNLKRHKKLKMLGDINFVSIDKNTLNNQIIPRGENIPDLKIDLASWKLISNCNKKDKYIEEINKYRDKKIKLNFDFGFVTLPQTKDCLHLKGQIPMIISIGCTPKEDLDLKHIKESQNKCNQLAENLGIFKKDSKYFKKFQDVGVPELCLLTAPGVKLKNMTAYLILVSAFFILDDIFDNLCDFRTEALTVFETTHAVSVFCLIIRGEYDLDKNDPVSRFPKFYPLCKLMERLRMEVLALNKNWEETEYFCTSFVEYLEASAWESLGWNDPTQTNTNALKRLYFIQRDLTIGIRPCLDIICLLKGVILYPEIRRDPLFKSLQSVYARLIILENDIFSVRKEIQNGETSNIILIRNFRKPAEYCINRTLKDVEECIQDIFSIQKQLALKFPHTKDLQKFFEIGNVWMDAHIRWMFLCRRYINNSFSIDVSEN